MLVLGILVSAHVHVGFNMMVVASETIRVEHKKISIIQDIRIPKSKNKSSILKPCLNNLKSKKMYRSSILSFFFEDKLSSLLI